MIRRWLLILSLPLLILGLCLLRGYRFERLANEVSVSMADLRSALPNLPEGASWDVGKDGTILRVKALADRPDVAITFRLPVSAPVEALHIAVKVSSRNLVRGEREWEDGRVLLRWHSDLEREAIEIDPVASTRGSESGKRASLVTEPSSGAGYPVLVIENLAASGELLLSAVELTPVRHRAAWHWLRWVLVFCWLAWLVAALSGWPKISLPRRFAAAVVWLAMGIHFAFPGPWERLSPMIFPYVLGGNTTQAHSSLDGVTDNPKTKTPQGFVSEGACGEIPDHSGWIIRIRSQLKKQRHLLHVGFVVGVTCLFSCLVGLRRAAWLAGGLVVAMEGSQTGFGYGFDTDDFIDIVCGAVGIALGGALFIKLCRWNFFSRRVALPAAQLAPPSVADGAPDERQA